MTKQTKTEIAGFIFVGICGPLLHFAYQAFGNAAAVGLFAPVNESIWEHLKLLFFPALIWAAVEYRIYAKEKPRFFAVNIWALALSLAAIPIAFYTVSGVVGTHSFAVDIALFYLADALFFYLSHQFGEQKKEESEGENIAASILMLTLLFAFWIFTFFPPQIGLFQAP